MLQVVPQMKIYLAHQALDFRKGIDTLAGYCRNVLQKDPYSGAIFVFRNKRLRLFGSIFRIRGRMCFS